MNTLINELNRLPGFKISRSHFRIGTKLHLSDFYYAKLCFQNSFYSSRFAFLLARQIQRDISEKDWEDIRTKGLTIVGYGLYSEFMISLVHKFLLKSMNLKKDLINFSLVSDSTELGFLRKDFLHYYQLIIVPVACTLSTSIKIEQFLAENAKAAGQPIEIISPHYNLLLVSDKEETKDCTELERSFGWLSKDPLNRNIRVQAFYDGKERKTRYFLKLSTTWSHLQSCENCFPHENSERFPHGELPLLETDRTSLIPRIIFDYPKGKTLPSGTGVKNFILTPRMINYQPSRGTGHFLYQIDLPLFLQENVEQVINWLKDIRNSTSFQTRFNEYSHVIILAPAQSQNTGFLLLVNEYLFDSAGNIIHYDPATDYVQNFENLYGRELREADRVIFVNDSLSSGRHFFKLDELFRQSLRDRQKRKKNIVIDMALILLDQAPSIIFSAIKDRLDKDLGIYAFTQLNLFTSLSLDDPPLAQYFYKHYEQLAKESMLDGSRLHFLEQQRKFNNNSIHTPSHREQHWWMVKATHNLYEFFTKSDHKILTNFSFREFFDIFFKNEWAGNQHTPLRNRSTLLFSEEQSAVLKVLTHVPFTQYGPVLQLTFQWVIELLREHQENIKKKLLERGHDDINYEDFTWLKFLIRRAGALTINYLISVEFLKFLDLFYTRGIPQIQKKIDGQWEGLRIMIGNMDLLKDYEIDKDNQLKDLRQFHVFFVAQVKLLLYENEQRSVQLEKNIQQIKPTTPPFNQLLRVLQDENTVVIKRFSDALRARKEWKEMNLEKDDLPIVTDSDHPLVKLVTEPDILQHQHYHSLHLFFQQSELTTENANPEKNPLFLTFLTLVHFLEMEERSDKTIIEKTKFIFQRIKQLLEFKDPSEILTEKTGIFLLVKNYKKDLSLVYELFEEKPLLEQYFWLNGDEEYLQKFLEGISAPYLMYKKTIVELFRKNKNEKWQDLYSLTASEEINNLSSDFLPENLNHLILIRLNRREEGVEESLGMLGIYFERNSSNITDINRVRYLLLLRETLINFVEKHHRSNEFLELQQASEAKSMVLLAGHGRQMIIDLSELYKNENKGIYKSIATNLGQLQHIMTLLKYSESDKGFAAMIGGIYDIYHIDGKPVINDPFIAQLQQMAHEIYKFPEIENKVDMNTEFSNDSVAFPFNRQLIEIIVFELLVNAKKNRWHFLPSLPFPAGLEKNNLVLKVFEQKGFLHIEISNTGPTVSQDKMIQLQRESRDGKPPNLTSGTRLIKHLITSILKDEINFTQTPIGREEEGISLFTVKMRLRPMYKNESKKDFINRQSATSV